MYTFISEVKDRLEEAKANSRGQSDEGATPWGGIRAERYALKEQNYITLNTLKLTHFLLLPIQGEIHADYLPRVSFLRRSALGWWQVGPSGRTS